jgi:2,3-bisphosphoglycerate-dependent phosphoglycerate mutase
VAIGAFIGAPYVTITLFKETVMTKKLILLLYVCIFLLPAFAQTESALTTVVVVRHAEKSTTPKDDPVLTDAGKTRAAHLAEMLSNAGVQAIYTSQFERTKLTAEPLAKKLAIDAMVIDAAKSDELANTIRSKNAGQIVLVVGHSNTLPEIIHAFDGPEIPELDDNEYDSLFVLSVPESGESKLLKLKFN